MGSTKQNKMSNREHYRPLGLGDLSMLHGIDKRHPHVLVIQIEMKDTIDADLMRSAIDQAMRRFPYFKVSLHIGFRDVWFERNEADIVMNRGCERIKLCCKESNYHLLAFGYHDNKLLLHISHILTDGKGILALLRTVILHYCQLRYDARITNPDALTIDTPIRSEELQDPLMAKIPEDIGKAKNPKLPKAFRPDWVGQVTPVDRQFIWHISISSSQIDDLCQQHQVTPIILMNLLVARAMHRINKGQTQPIISAVPASARNITRCQDSMLNAALPLHVLYDSAFWQKDFGEQLIDVKQQIEAQTTPTVMWNNIRSMARLFSLMRLVPSSLRAFIMSKAFAKVVAINSFEMSFTGRMRLGETSQFVKTVFVDAAFKGSGLMLEMLSLDHSFCISYVQEWEDPTYLEAFGHELSAAGLSHTITASYQRDF